MKSFGERNPFVIGAIGVGITAVVLLVALNFDKIPFVNRSTGYSAYLAEASGLIADAPVLVSGYQVGKVTSIQLDGPRVLVDFNVADGIRLGDRTEVATKLTCLGLFARALSARR